MRLRKDIWRGRGKLLTWSRKDFGAIKESFLRDHGNLVVQSWKDFWRDRRKLLMRSWKARGVVVERLMAQSWKAHGEAEEKLMARLRKGLWQGRGKNYGEAEGKL